jgi:hypothetical protein
MAEQGTKAAGDKGIGEGNLSRERGAPPYADKAYAGESEPAGIDTGNTAGNVNVSKQGGGTGSSKQGGNTTATPDAK